MIDTFHDRGQLGHLQRELVSKSSLTYLRWPNTVFQNLCVIPRYFQTTGSWAAKISKIQVQLKNRLRVVSNFGDGDCGADEIHTRARNFEETRREGSAEN